MKEAPRMFFSEVAAIMKLSKGTLNLKIKRGEFPAPIDRGREKIFATEDVYNALGMRIPNENTAEKRMLAALDKKNGKY